MNILVFIISFYIICWISFIMGFIFIKTKSNAAIKIEKIIWNTRIDKFQKKPFNIVITLQEKKKYFKLMFLVIILNISIVILQLVLGYILISPIVIIILGFNAGLLIAQADKRTMIFSFFVLIFELGAFSTSAGIGFYNGINLIFKKETIINTLTYIIKQGYFLIPILCLILNGIFEATGVLFNIEGVPGIKAYKEKKINNKEIKIKENIGLALRACGRLTFGCQSPNNMS